MRGHISKLIQQYGQDISMVTTGHSLGGALSAVCALSTKILFPSMNIEIHNFGQPRIGNKRLTDHMHRKMELVFRVVHNRDLVPHLPPDLPLFDYHHSGNEVFFNEDMSVFKVCADSGEDRSCWKHGSCCCVSE